MRSCWRRCSAHDSTVKVSSQRRRVGGVAEHAPELRAVAPADAREAADGLDELVGARRVDAILDGDQHRAAVGGDVPRDRDGAGTGSAGVRSSALGRAEPEAARHDQAADEHAAGGDEQRVGKPVWVATHPHSSAPTAMLPWITSRLTASARARTQPDTDVCAAVLMLDIIAIHAAPPPTQDDPGDDRVADDAERGAGEREQQVAAAISRSIAQCCAAVRPGARPAPRTAPRPRQPSSRP